VRALVAVLAGAEAFTDIARFGENKLELLRRFRRFEHGAPARDHLGDIFATLDAQAFQRCFVDWVAAPTKTPAGVIAIILRRAQQPLVSGSFGRLFGGPWCLSGQHGVGEDEELSRASDKGEFVGFASDFQAAVQCDQGWILLESCGQGGGVETFSDAITSAGDMAATLAFAAVVVERGKPSKSCNRFTR
jgi:DDE_Tnp_1-associated